MQSSNNTQSTCRGYFVSGSKVWQGLRLTCVANACHELGTPGNVHPSQYDWVLDP